MKGADLLAGTPILDVKPYLAWADSFPEATRGWVAEEEARSPAHRVDIEAAVLPRIEALERETGKNLRELLADQLGIEPTLAKAKRVKARDAAAGEWTFAWRTWRFDFTVGEGRVTVTDLREAEPS